MCMAPNILYNTDMFVVTDAKAITQFWTDPNETMKIPTAILSSNMTTRLKSKVFSLERLYPLFRVKVSKTPTNIGSKSFFGSTRILWVRINFVFETNFWFGTGKNLWSEKFWHWKMFWVLNRFKKEIWDQKKSLWVWKQIWVKKNLG